jgi:hypothetical protein
MDKHKALSRQIAIPNPHNYTGLKDRFNYRGGNGHEKGKRDQENLGRMGVFFF